MVVGAVGPRDVDVARAVDVRGRKAGGAARDRVALRNDAVRPRVAAVLRDGEVDLLALRPRHHDRVQGRNPVHRPREVGIGCRDRRGGRVGETAVGRLDHDRVPRLLLVVREEHCLVVDERRPLSVGKGAVRRNSTGRVDAR